MGPSLALRVRVVAVRFQRGTRVSLALRVRVVRDSMALLVRAGV